MSKNTTDLRFHDSYGSYDFGPDDWTLAVLTIDEDGKLSQDQYLITGTQAMLKALEARIMISGRESIAELNRAVEDDDWDFYQVYAAVAPGKVPDWGALHEVAGAELALRKAVKKAHAKEALRVAKAQLKALS